MKSENIFLRGIPASPGITVGEALFFISAEYPITRKLLHTKEVTTEIERFEQACERTRMEVEEIKKKLSQEVGNEHARFLDAQILLLEDRIIEETKDIIKRKKLSAESSFQLTTEKFLRTLEKIENPYLRERIIDVKDVRSRLLKNLAGHPSSLPELSERVIIIAHRLTPSDTAEMRKDNLLGFATDLGGKTSHTSIMARALEIPAVVGVENLTTTVEDGDTVIIDGRKGIVVVNPDESTLRTYEAEKIRYEQLVSQLCALKDLPTTTVDGHTIELSANIEFTEEIESVKSHGAEGIGLFRTEFIFLIKDGEPSEDEQFNFYKNVVDSIYPKPVIIRTVDLGGDKLYPGEKIEESNPFLGWRAIRSSLDKKDQFKTQLKAILRTTSKRNVKIMFPMISTVEEVKMAKEILESVKQDLRKRGTSFDEGIEVGVMVEIPSAAILAPVLAKEVDFFSIGSNDLTQYTLAVDRGNKLVANLYDHLHPAVLRLIRMVIDEAHKNNIWVGVCGEMASDPLAVPVLIGLGVDELSTSPSMLLQTKDIIRSLSMKEAKEIVKKVFYLNTVVEIRKHMKKDIRKRLPHLSETLACD